MITGRRPLTLATLGTVSLSFAKQPNTAEHEAVLKTASAPVSLSVSFILIHRRQSKPEADPNPVARHP
ncbi:hypothetical protein ABZ619_39980 [Streptomyces sp. NPDC007851]|uniref:hypothetical protein n=1 Tax=Streptomyces sp. NPDC007851 TaxID=3155008 RepID=UPI003405A4BF